MRPESCEQKPIGKSKIADRPEHGTTCPGLLVEGPGHPPPLGEHPAPSGNDDPLYERGRGHSSAPLDLQASQILQDRGLRRFPAPQKADLEPEILRFFCQKSRDGLLGVDHVRSPSPLRSGSRRPPPSTARHPTQAQTFVRGRPETPVGPTRGPLPLRQSREALFRNATRVMGPRKPYEALCESASANPSHETCPSVQMSEASR